MKRKKMGYIALALCIVLIINCADVSGFSLVLRPVQAADESEPQLPVGGLEKVEVSKVNRGEIANVPSYGDVSLYSNEETIFEDGTGDYGMDCLSEVQKELYSNIESSLKGFLRDDDAVFEEITLNGEIAYTPFKAGYQSKKLGEDQLIQVWTTFRANHPWLYWLKGFVYGGGEFVPLVIEEYEKNLAGKKATDKLIEKNVQEYIDAVSDMDDIYEKVRIVYDKLIQDVNYAYKEDGKTAEDANWAHSILGVLDGEHNTVVCEGYSKAFSFILNILDIPNVYITGDAGGGHAWNAVSFDGGDTYYYMDATWDDHGAEEKPLAENYYAYFSMPKDIFEKEHMPNTPDKKGNDWQYALPVLGNDMEYTYYMRYAAYAAEGAITDEASAKEFLKGARVLAPGENCLLLLPDQDVLDRVAGALGLSGWRYSVVRGYNMILFVNKAEDFHADVPAGIFSLSDSELVIDKSVSGEAPLTIASVTENSDDYITVYSTDTKVAMVKPFYVKAKTGEKIRIIAKEEGKAVICADSKEGGKTVSCQITVIDGSKPKPTASPTVKPTASPTPKPTASPTPKPTASPTPKPTASPTVKPTASPTAKPTASPTVKPTASPTIKPTASPTVKPTASPTVKPTVKPTASPTVKPTASPTVKPTASSTAKPTASPTVKPTASPTVKPTASPTVKPTAKPTASPTAKPTITPVPKPTVMPTIIPTARPTESPVVTPTANPSPAPRPTLTPVPTSRPSDIPVITPTVSPDGTPYIPYKPVIIPGSVPTATPAPSATPSVLATLAPSEEPADMPGNTPEVTPSGGQAVAPAPSIEPEPSEEPTDVPKADNKKKPAKSLKKGAMVSDSKTKAVYKVTGTGKNKTVEYVRSTKKNASKIAIPAKVKLRGHNYKVTSIAKNALKNNKKLSYVIIGKNVRKIGKKAFYGCKKLRYIYVKSKKLTENNIGGQAFGGGYHSPRVKTAKNIWKQYSNVFLLRGMSKKALFVIDPVKLVI